MEIWVITDWAGCILGAYSTSERALVEAIEKIMGLEWLDNIDKKNAIIQLAKNYSSNSDEFSCDCQGENRCSFYVEKVEVDKE